MNGDLMIRWHDEDVSLRELLEQAGDLLAVPFDLDEPVDLVDERELFEATVADVREILASLEPALEDDMAAGDRETLVRLVVYLQVVLLRHELELFAVTPTARFLHFNPEEGQ